MKYVFVVNNVVVGLAVAHLPDVLVRSTIDEATTWPVADDVSVDVGWTCSETDGVAVFLAPAVTLPLLTPMTLYMAFTTTERIEIKASKDPFVIEFWDMYQLSVQLDKPTDPNLVSVRQALGYLAAPVDPGPGAGILASAERVEQILAGIPQ